MKFATAFRSRVAALFAMLFLCFGMMGGFPGLVAQEDASPFIVAAQAAEGGGVMDLFGSNAMSELDGNTSTNMDTVTDKVRDVATTVTTILTIISFLCLLFWIARLAMSAGNPMTRKQALTGILFSGVALALFGGSWIVVSFFWNFLSGT